MDEINDIVIVCAGGFGKEALTIIEHINQEKKKWNILGFIDDVKEKGEIIYHGYKVIDKIDNLIPKKGLYLAMGISDPKSKEILYNKLKEKGFEFATLIRPNVIIQPETIIGEGSVIGNAWIGTNVILGKCVNIAGSMVGGSEIGDFSTTTGFANIAAAKLGKRVFVGSHAVVLNGRKVGDDAFICAGSIVFTNVKPGNKVIGNPAKKLKI